MVWKNLIVAILDRLNLTLNILIRFLQFEEWYSSEFDTNLEEILAAGSPGVVLSIAQTCNKLNSKQAHFLVVS